jgi:hypothetical protein
MPELTIATGDIVGSSQLTSDELDGAMAALREASRLIWRWRSASQPPELVRFRGDGWQAALPAPALALRACLFFRARLRCLGQTRDTRISIGIGAGHLAPAGALNASAGPAFELSGRGLDTLPRAARFSVAHVEERADQALNRAIFALGDEISRRWTVRQAEVFSRMLPPDAGPQKSAAEDLGITQQMVAKHLRAGGDWALRQAMATLEADNGFY